MADNTLRCFLLTLITVLTASTAPAQTFVPPSLVDSIGSSGTENGQFNLPRGVSVNTSNGQVYVADWGNSRIQYFDSGNGYLGQWGGLNLPTGVSVNSDTGRVYVADTENNKVKWYSGTGVLQGEQGFGGSNIPGQFFRPRAVQASTVGPNTVYVADTGYRRVQVSNGSTWTVFPAPASFNPDSLTLGLGTVFAGDSTNRKVVSYTLSGQLNGTLNLNQTHTPGGLYYSESTARLYLTDTSTDRIYVYRYTGTLTPTLLGSWGGNGSASDQFNDSMGIAGNQMGVLYVANSFNHRVDRFFIPSEWTIPGTNTFPTVTLNENLTLTTGYNLVVSEQATVNPGATLTVNGVAFSSGSVTVATTAALAGTGTVDNVAIQIAGLVKPGGAGVGALTLGSTSAPTAATVTGRYEFDLVATGPASASGTGGSSPALPHTNHDVLRVNGILDLTTADVSIRSLGGLGQSGLDPMQSYSWLIATADGGIIGSPQLGPVNGTDFSEALTTGGRFNLSSSGSSLYLHFTPVPEPNGLIVFAAVGVGVIAVCRWRLSRNSSQPNTRSQPVTPEGLPDIKLAGQGLA